MVIRQTLTPEAFLAAPRRSAAVPAPSGRLAFFTSTTHPFTSSEGRAEGAACELMLLSLDTRHQWLLSTATDSDEDGQAVDEAGDDIHDICWIPAWADEASDVPDELVWLRPAHDTPGATEIVVAETAAIDGPVPPPRPYVAGVVSAPVQTLRLGLQEDGTVLLAVTGPPDDEDEQPNDQNTSLLPSGSTARIYDTWRVDTRGGSTQPQRQVIWYGALVRKGKGKADESGRNSRNSVQSALGRWSLAGPLHNALQYAAPGLTCLTAVEDLDVGPQGIVFVGRDDSRMDLPTDSSSVYYVPLDRFTEPPTAAPARVALTPLPSSCPPDGGLSSSSPPPPPGFASNVRFSPDGSAVAFLWAPLDCPADRRLHLGHLQSGAAVDVARVITGIENWAVVPYALEFVPSGEAVILQAHDCGRRNLFWLDLQPGARPRLLTKAQASGRQLGSVSEFHVLQPSSPSPATVSLLISGSSFVESSFYYLVDVVITSPADGNDDAVAFEPRLVASTRDASRYVLSHEAQVSEMYFEGAGDGYFVQAWVVRPSSSVLQTQQEQEQGKHYPLALLVHDGPEGAWEDEWQQTCWNAALWAEQGFVVVLPNITGSAGFGLEHMTRIYGSWGGFPYEDLTQCMNNLKEVPYIDMDHAVLAGGGYGGYMVNWIHGSSLARKFRAAVAHDPVFSTVPRGFPSVLPDGVSNCQSGLQRWNPARADRLGRWRSFAPPTLVVQTSNDDTGTGQAEGLAAFRDLQFQGVPSRYLAFSTGSKDGRREADDALAWYQVVFAWLRQWTAKDCADEERRRQQTEEN